MQRKAREEAQRKAREEEQRVARELGSPPLPPPQRPSQLPPGWKQAKDEQGQVYYYNKSLNITQYDQPSIVDSPPMRPPQARTSAPGSTSAGSTRASLAVELEAEQRQK